MEAEVAAKSEPTTSEIFSLRLIQSPRMGKPGKSYFIRSLIHGLGSLVVLHSPSREAYLCTPKTSVNKALGSDMVRLGRDMRVVIGREEGKAQTGKTAID